MSQPSDSTRCSSVLSYQSSGHSVPRRWWVYTVTAIYLALLGSTVTVPFWMGDMAWQWAIPIAALFVCGIGLMIVPVRSIRRRPITRRSIWFPIIASGLLAAGLFYGGAMALGEYKKLDSAGFELMAMMAVTLWILWAGVFIPMAFAVNPTSLAMQLHRILIAGSVMELLVAVPTHIVVRRRTECCAGIYTGIAICLGVAVMLVSFGPSVLFLYHRRRRQIKAD